MPGRDHTEMEELAAAYALDALERDEVDAFERHLSECPRCRADVQEFRETAALLAHAGAAAPDGLWDRIASELDEAPNATAAVLPLRSSSTNGSSSLRRWRPAFIAAAALVAVVLGVNTATLIGQNRDIEGIQTAQSIANLRVLAQRAQQDPLSRLAVLVSADGAVSADAVITRDGTGYLLASFNKLDAAHSYQLWGLADGKKPVSLGVLGQRVDAVSFRAKPGIAKLAVTVEAAKGAAAPTTMPIVAGSLDFVS